MTRQSEDTAPASVSKLLDKAYESFGLEGAGVTRGEFSGNPALHLRNLSRRLQMGNEATVQDQADAQTIAPKRGPEGEYDE
jgi:hypothetical protein